MEFSREQKIWSKVRKQNVRVREKNQAESRLLSRRLHQLNVSCHRVEAWVDKEIKDIKDQIWKQEGLDEFNATDEAGSVLVSELRTPISSAKKLRAKSAPITRSKNEFSRNWRNNDDANHSCKYMTSRSCYGVFPCKEPSQYHKIGFGVKSGEEHCNIYSTSMQMFAKSREGFIIDLESHSVRRPQRTSMDQTNHKISALRTIISEMKTRSEANKPKDWCVNYGKPISKRKLLKVARPSSVEEFQGL